MSVCQEKGDRQRRRQPALHHVLLVWHLLAHALLPQPGPDAQLKLAREGPPAGRPLLAATSPKGLALRLLFGLIPLRDLLALALFAAISGAAGYFYCKASRE